MRISPKIYHNARLNENLRHGVKLLACQQIIGNMGTLDRVSRLGADWVNNALI